MAVVVAIDRRWRWIGGGANLSMVVIDKEIVEGMVVAMVEGGGGGSMVVEVAL